MVNDQLLAFGLFFTGLIVLIAMTAMIYYYDRKYYGDRQADEEPGGVGGEP